MIEALALAAVIVATIHVMRLVVRKDRKRLRLLERADYLDTATLMRRSKRRAP